MTTRRKELPCINTCDLINGGVSATSPSPLLLLVVSGSMWACGRRLSNQSMHLGAFWEDYFLISLIWICIWSDFWDCHIREATLKLVGVPKVLSEFCRVLNEFFMMQLFFQLCHPKTRMTLEISIVRTMGPIGWLYVSDLFSLGSRFSIEGIHVGPGI